MREVETTQDRANEVAVLEYVCGDSAFTYRQTEKMCRYDAEIFFCGELKVIVEIKCRKFAHDKYPDFMFKVDKWSANKKIAKEKGVKFFILFAYTDGIYYIDETDATLKGRNISEIVMKNTHNGKPERVFFTPIKELKRLVRRRD